MQAIPDTGPGLSGFLAHLLWQVYAWFPSAGRYDWALLLLAIGPAICGLYVPWMWKAIGADMRTLKDGVMRDLRFAHAMLLAGATLYVLLWFFHTSAGKTFLGGRAAWWIEAPTDVSRSFYFLVLGVVVATGVAAGVCSAAVERRYRSLASAAMVLTRPAPYPDRSLLSLYGHGGVFLLRNEREGKTLNVNPSALNAASVLNLIPLLFYWYWSVASLVLMLGFLLGALASEAVRMLFVYVHHKRTFG